MPLIDLFFSMLWFFLFIAWFWVVVSVIADMIRSDDLSGISKALWVIFVIVVPWLGVLVYLIARGDKMAERGIRTARAREDAARSYIQSAAGTSPADEVRKLAELRAAGIITDAEFEAQKAKALA